MSIYTTPLQFGYFFSLIVWVLLLIRGYREQRLSDRMLGWMMFILAMELQDYTFGFAGINFLWDELNGFPRSVSLLFGPVVYFYFQAQTNRRFHLQKEHLAHFLPFGGYVTYKLFFFIQGSEAVEALHASRLDLVLGYVLRIGLIVSFFYYLSRCLGIYTQYRIWSTEQFSNLEIIDFKWFRNFIYSMIFWLAFRELMFILDALFSLDFYQDWWWNLALAAVAVYIGLAGYSQKQPAWIDFDSSPKPVDQGILQSENQISELDKEDRGPGQFALSIKLGLLMQKERLYLQPELSLYELAQHLQSNPVQLSATINKVFGMNFNDYINSLRVDEFVRRYAADVNRR
nr:hypothetical protein [Cytophagales bacterium]